VLVAVDDVQFLAPHESEHLTHRGFAGASVTHQQSRLAVLHTPAPHTLYSSFLPLSYVKQWQIDDLPAEKNSYLPIMCQYIDPLADVHTYANAAAHTNY